MNIINGDFPFEVLAQFDSRAEAIAAGYENNQIWSVVYGDSGSHIYGPSRHYVNNLGYVVTAARHDDDTYYQEEW